MVNRLINIDDTTIVKAIKPYRVSHLYGNPSETL